MKIDDVLVMWEQDAEIDGNHLDASSIESAKLHAKYIKLLVNAKLRKTKLGIEYAELRKHKFRYYRGELTKQELQDLGWEQWQYNKPLKSDMDEFLRGDNDLNTIQTRIEYMDTMIYALESILQQIKGRDWQIRNSIEYKKFLAGN